MIFWFWILIALYCLLIDSEKISVSKEAIAEEKSLSKFAPKIKTKNNSTLEVQLYLDNKHEKYFITIDSDENYRLCEGLLMSNESKIYSSIEYYFYRNELKCHWLQNYLLPGYNNIAVSIFSLGQEKKVYREVQQIFIDDDFHRYTETYSIQNTKVNTNENLIEIFFNWKSLYLERFWITYGGSLIFFPVLKFFIFDPFLKGFENRKENISSDNPPSLHFHPLPKQSFDKMKSHQINNNENTNIKMKKNIQKIQKIFVFGSLFYGLTYLISTQYQNPSNTIKTSPATFISKEVINQDNIQKNHVNLEENKYDQKDTVNVFRKDRIKKIILIFRSFFFKLFER